MTTIFIYVIIIIRILEHVLDYYTERFIMQTIDYDGMSQYMGKSTRTLRRWETEKPLKFEVLLDEYTKSLEETFAHDSESILILVANFKGGTGKSTLADALAYYLDDAVILNLDIAQRSKNTNATKTIDYVDLLDNYTVEQVIRDLKNKYKYVIIDTPGDSTDEVLEVAPLVKNIIIPMTLGKRSREATNLTLLTFFGEDPLIKGDVKTYFIFNIYRNKAKRLDSTEKFKKMLSNFVSNEKDPSVTLKPKLDGLDFSDAIYTAEEEGKSIFELAEENRAAYKSILGKMSSTCKKMETFFEL